MNDGPDAAPEDRSTGRLLAALAFPALVVDVAGRVTAVNDAASALVGAPRDGLRGAPAVEVLFAEPERGAAGELLATVLAGDSWEGILPVVAPDGGTRPIGLSITALREDQHVVGALIAMEALAGDLEPGRRLTERLSRLARVTSELLFADDVTAVTGIVTGHMADAAGATVASLSLVIEEGRLQLIGIRGGLPGVIDRWKSYDAHGNPAGDCVTSGRTLVLTGRDEIRARYPTLESAAPGERSMVCLPLRVADRAVGVVTMSFPGRRAFGRAEMEFYELLADTCSQAIDRVQARSAAADQAAKLQFLADATAELSSSLDYESTLSNVARSAVPWFADWCAIALDFEGELRTLAVAHVDPRKVALARDFQDRYPPDPDAPRGSYQVFRSGRSELTPEISDEMIDALITDEVQRSMVRELNLRSAMAVPLKVNDRVLGVVTWVAGEQGRRFAPEDVSFGEDLARRAAVAIENAQLHTEVREMAMRLQRAVLPTDLPELEGWELGAHYSPAGHLTAGGDFYDVIPLGAGRVAWFIGDVMGRGVHAAAAMAQMRSATRALLAIDSEPVAVMTGLDTVFERYDLEQLVTMLYAVMDTASGEVVITNAGHLAPVVVRASGAVEVVELAEGLLLGAGASTRSAATFTLGPGDALLAFTDGLIERRREGIDDGQQRLVDSCERLRVGVLSDALADLVKLVSDPVRDDDVAALVLRRRG